MKTHLAALTLCLLGLNTALSAATPTILVSDDFTLPAGVAPGDDVRYHFPKSGEMSYDTKYLGQPAIAYFESDGNGYLGYQGEGSPSRRILLPISSSDLPEGASTIGFEVTVDGSGMTNYMVGFGNSNARMGCNMMTDGQLIFSIISKESNSVFAIRSQGQVVLRSRIKKGGPLRLGIAYNIKTNTIVAATIGGNVICQNVDLNELGLKPDIKAFQMQFSGIEGSTSGQLIADDLVIAASE